jgi:hypothetical protein
MSQDRWLEEFRDVRIPMSLNSSLSEIMAALRSRIFRDAVRRAVLKAGIRNCVVSTDDLAESIQAAFQEGPSECLSALKPVELSHVRRAS